MPFRHVRMIYAASSVITVSVNSTRAGTTTGLGAAALRTAFLRAGALRFLTDFFAVFLLRFAVARFVDAAARFVFFVERFAAFFFDAFFFVFLRAMGMFSFSPPRVESSARGVNGQFARTFHFRARVL